MVVNYDVGGTRSYRIASGHRAHGRMALERSAQGQDVAVATIGNRYEAEEIERYKIPGWSETSVEMTSQCTFCREVGTGLSFQTAPGREADGGFS